MIRIGLGHIMTDGKVSLRQWTLEDAPVLAEIINNKNVQDNLNDLPYPYTVNDAIWFINSISTGEKDMNYIFAITFNDNPVGCIGLHRGTGNYCKIAELGYYLDENYWGKGIMTKAIKQVCAFGFETTDIVRIYARPFSYNKASTRVLEKAGFQFEGVLRKNAIKNGQLIDMAVYAIIKDDL